MWQRTALKPGGNGIPPGFGSLRFARIGQMIHHDSGFIPGSEPQRMAAPAKDGTMRANLPSCSFLVVLLALVLLYPGPVHAQANGVRDWNKVDDTLTGGIGLHYGKLGGNGLAFRVPLKWYAYLQLGGGVWHTNDNQRHNVGIQLDYLLRQDSRLRLYIAGGLGYFYHREKTGTSDGVDIWEKKDVYNVGAGVGGEYLIGTRVALQLELDFVHESDSGNITVAPQVGLYYYW